MKCRTAKILIQDYIDGTLDGADTGLMENHLQDCAACREDYRCSLSMIDLLKEIPVTPASAGFADRVLSNASRSQPATAGSRINYLAGGIAASLGVLVVTLSMMTLSFMQDPAAPQPDAVVLIEDRLQTIRVAIDSPRAVDDIRMAIDVSDNLEIQGYGDQRGISLTTSLARGVNLITLPVTAIATGDGEIVARIGLGERQKILRIRTRHEAAGNAGRGFALLAAIVNPGREQRL